MNISNGTALGPYEILEPLGAGGMGEVYRARDTRLDRSVAIKVLRDGIATGTLRARFDREAKAISGLTHAHICALFDVGHQNGIDYLVMEYLEGETLAAKIARGPLPLSQVLRYGAEIAQALHHAHRRGITHRDLKPGNVMVTAGGVKLLDFGLAKLAESPSDTLGAPDAVTRKDPLTAEGTIVGTLPYMSPEHVEGRTVDSRSDIFSLGVMLYEMATGRRPFHGNSQAALIASILSSDPPSEPLLSPALDRVIRTALEKDPDERWQTAQDLARQLRWISEPSAQIAAAPSRSRRRLPIAAALLLLACTAALLGWLAARLRSNAAASAPSMRLTIALPGLRLMDSFETCPFAISPDGKKIAMIGWSGDDTMLFVRALDETRLQKIEGTDGASAPFWSSDSAWIGYGARGKLWKIQPAGGPPQAICDLSVRGAVASWQGDTILFAERPGARPNVFRVAAAGGEPAVVTRVSSAEREVRHTFPQLLDDGTHFLFVATIDESGEKRLELASLDSPVRRRIATNVSRPRLVGDRLLYVRDGKLLSQPFTLEKLLQGEPAVLAEDVSFVLPTASAQFDVSKNGVLVYRRNTSSGRMLLVGRDGGEIRVVDEQGLITTIDVSPDGRKAAVTVKARATSVMDIWIYDLARGVRDRFTSAANVETDPVWSPDGRSLVYSVGTGSPPSLVLHSLSEPTPRKIAVPGSFQLARSISPDGKSLYFMTYGPGRTHADIYRTVLDGSNRSEPVVNSDFEEILPMLSPDGRWLAYVSNATGTHEVYLQNLATSERIRISNRGGLLPCWRADSGELFYLPAGRRSVMSATPDARGNWNDVTLTEIFHRREPIAALDALPDGKSFLISEITPGAADEFIHVAMGW